MAAHEKSFVTTEQSICSQLLSGKISNCDSCKICSISGAGRGHNVRTQRYADQAYPRALGKIL